jgi:tRNA pseudouridine55 synthase
VIPDERSGASRGAQPAAPCPDGVLVVDKPSGPTSFEVVSRVKRLLRGEKAGHTGTLDPLATGVLAVCIGEAVKLQQFLCDGDKAYQATIAFGAATTTEDAEGEVTERGDPSRLEAPAIREALERFVGDLEQVPPMYSAVRVSGRRLHEAARAGEQVERPARKVRVHALELAELRRGDELLQAVVRVRCGKGTYVRTLAADLGRALGVPAHLAALRRTEAGPFGLEEAITLEDATQLASTDRSALHRRLVPLERALRSWPAVSLSPGAARDLGHGQAVATDDAPAGLCCALDPDGRLLAVCQRRDGLLRPLRVLRAIR